MTGIRTEIVVDAPPHEVWDVLADVASYGRWHPEFERASGPVEQDGALELSFSNAAWRPGSGDAVLTVVDPPRELEWRRTLLAGPLYQARRTFELKPLEGGGTRFVHRLSFGGVLGPFLGSRIDEAELEATNEALADAVGARRSQAAQ